MEKHVEITLDRSKVLPLLETLSAIAVRGSRHSSMAAADLQALTALMQPPFAETGLVIVTRTSSPAILRACSLAHAELRATELSSLSDEVIELPLNPADYSGQLQAVVALYSLLSDLQAVVLEHLPLTDRIGAFGRVWRRVLRALRLRRPVGARDRSEVVLHNDHVNVMRYVRQVLQVELLLSEASAGRHVQEVDERHLSVVWRGERTRADAYANALRFWHLNAEARDAQGE